MFDFGKRQRILELNPKSPLIQGTVLLSLDHHLGGANIFLRSPAPRGAASGT
jgi:hypothetical protein